MTGPAARRLEEGKDARPAERALSLRHRRCDRLLALSLAAEVEGGAGDRKSSAGRQRRRPGHRQGSRTVLANTVARAFDLEAHEVEVRIGNSTLSVGPASGGSRTTASVVPPTLMAIDKLKAEIQQDAAAPGRRLQCALARPDRVLARHPRPACAVRTARTSRPACARRCKEVGFMGFVFGLMLRWFSNIAVGAGVPSSVQVIEVEVDTWLGHVKVLKVHTGIAVGKLASPDSRATRRRARWCRASAMRSMRGAKSIRQWQCPDRGPGGLSHSRHRGHAAASTCISTKAASAT